MRSIPKSRRAWPFAGLVALAFSQAIRSADAAPPPDRDRLRATLKQLWDSLETVEFVEEDYRLDARGRPEREVGYSRIAFALGSGGRRAYKVTAVWPATGKENLSTDEREDGRRAFTVGHFPDRPDLIDTVAFRNQEDTHEDYRGSMTGALWSLTPAGKPLHAHLDAGAALESAPGDDGAERIVLVSTYQGTPLRCELDPDHDYLPRRVVSVGSFEARVARFRRDDGRWFPAEGVITYTDLKKYYPHGSGYVVTDVRINRAIPDSRFNPLPLPPGTREFDVAMNTMRIVGGREARKALDLAFPPRPAPAGARPIVASREPERFPWVALLAAGSLAAFAAAGALALRRSRSRI